MSGDILSRFIKGIMKKWLVALGLILLAVGERLWFDLGPNVELVMLSSVVAGLYLGRWWGVLVGVVSLLVSDMVLGNTWIALFTWSAFGLIGAGGVVLRRWRGEKRMIAGMGYGLAAATWFYLYTNFGVWLISGMYERTLIGLWKSYVMALPFFGVHAVSNMLMLPAGLGLLELVSNSALLGKVEQKLAAEWKRK